MIHNDTEVQTTTVTTYQSTPASTNVNNDEDRVPASIHRHPSTTLKRIDQSSSIMRALFVGLRPDVEATLSSSLMGVTVARALARFFLWYSRSLFFFCCAAESSCGLGAGGTMTVVRPGVDIREWSSAPDSSPSPDSSRDLTAARSGASHLQPEYDVPSYMLCCCWRTYGRRRQSRTSFGLQSGSSDSPRSRAVCFHRYAPRCLSSTTPRGCKSAPLDVPSLTMRRKVVSGAPETNQLLVYIPPLREGLHELFLRGVVSQLVFWRRVLARHGGMARFEREGESRSGCWWSVNEPQTRSDAHPRVGARAARQAMPMSTCVPPTSHSSNVL